MFKYQNGSEVMVGDSVLFENGTTSGTVDLIVITEEEMKSINVQGAGLMLKSPPFGLVYLTEHWLKNDPLKFVARASA